MFGKEYAVLLDWTGHIHFYRDSKNSFSPNSSNQYDFVKKIGWYACWQIMSLYGQILLPKQ